MSETPTYPHLLNDSINRLHTDMIGLRGEIKSLQHKIDELNEKKIIPLQIFKARTLALFACLSMGGGAVGNKIDKVFFPSNDRSHKIEKPEKTK